MGLSDAPRCKIHWQFATGEIRQDEETGHGYYWQLWDVWGRTVDSGRADCPLCAIAALDLCHKEHRTALDATGGNKRKS